ncbi:MAG: hypothetical protein ABW166_04885 [Sedimenticola sp.]
MNDMINTRHNYIADVYDHLAVKEKYLFKTHSTAVALNIHICSNSTFLMSINKCYDVTQEGIHIPSFALDDNDKMVAECEVYKKPVYTTATLWNETLVTPATLGGTMRVTLAPHSTYIILSKEPAPVLAAYYLLQFNWSEERKEK